MILIGIGSNLPSTAGPPLATCRAAIAAFPGEGITVKALSRWYATAPLPISAQPEFVNGVALVDTRHGPEELLAALHRIETSFGRERGAVNEARKLDLDVLDYDGLTQPGPPILPHPRLHERAFVLVPLLDVAPHWQHPDSRRTAAVLLAEIKPDQRVRPMSDP